MGTVTLAPVAVKPPMWEHQRRGLEFARAVQGSLLHCGMGTGKSRVIVELANIEDVRRVLVVCPVSVMAVWPNEFRKYGAKLRQVLVLDSGTCDQKAATMRKALADAPSAMQVVVVLNYEAAWRGALAQALLKAKFDVVVLDESHRIKSPSGKASRFFAKLGAVVRRRICLTGTPMPHGPLDVYGQLRFADPSVFGTSYTAFRGMYGVMNPNIPGKVVRYQNLEDLQSRLARVTFQAGRGVLDLPPAMHVERTCVLESKARKIYEKLKEDAVAEIEQGLITVANAGVRLLRLRQVCGGHTKTEDGAVVEVGSEKADLLADVLEDIAIDEPVVVFASFRSELDSIRAAALACKRPAGELSGKAKDLAAWQKGECNLLAVQLQAGGVGIDLTRARYCIYFSVGFNNGDYEQSLARVHRPGQTQPVTYIHLIAENTVDRTVYGALRAKRDVSEAVLSELGLYAARAQGVGA